MSENEEPVSLPPGKAEITVIANGISSNPVSVNGWIFPWPRDFDMEAWTFLIGSLASGLSPPWRLLSVRLFGSKLSSDLSTSAVTDGHRQKYKRQLSGKSQKKLRRSLQ